MSLTIAEMKQYLETHDSNRDPLYADIFLGHYIVTTPEFTYEEVNGKPVKIWIHNLYERKLRRGYYRNRQNGRGRKTVTVQMIIETLRDCEMMWDVKKQREAENFDRYLTNLDKLFILDPENQEF